MAIWSGLKIGGAALAAMLALGLVTGACRIMITDDQARLWRTLLLFLPGAVLVSLLEEMVFRGYLLQRLLACSTLTGIVVSSVLYAFVHLKSPEWTPQTWMELGGLFLLGTVLAVSYLRTGQLYLAMGLHAALAYGARINKLLIEFSDATQSWLTGTSRLVNGLAGWAILGVIGGIMWWWTRRVRGGIRNEA